MMRLVAVRVRRGALVSSSLQTEVLTRRLCGGPSCWVHRALHPISLVAVHSLLCVFGSNVSARRTRQWFNPAGGTSQVLTSV